MKLEFIPVKTRIVKPPKDEIWDILDALPPLHDNDIVFITSKILAIHQGRTVPIGSTSKVELIQREASHYLPYKHPSGFNVNLAITNNILAPAAGIDESNGCNHYILLPKDSDKLCREIRTYLCSKNKIKNLGVVSTDSHTTPLRWGVTGFTLGLAGVEPLKDVRGNLDLFGREMHLTQVNKIDPLASMAVLLMGETNEGTPIVLLRGYSDIVFNDVASMEQFTISPEMDLYRPLLEVLPERKVSNF